MDGHFFVNNSFIYWKKIYNFVIGAYSDTNLCFVMMYGYVCGCSKMDLKIVDCKGGIRKALKE